MHFCIFAGCFGFMPMFFYICYVFSGPMFFNTPNEHLGSLGPFPGIFRSSELSPGLPGACRGKNKHAIIFFQFGLIFWSSGLPGFPWAFPGLAWTPSPGFSGLPVFRAFPGPSPRLAWDPSPGFSGLLSGLPAFPWAFPGPAREKQTRDQKIFSSG